MTKIDAFGIYLCNTQNMTDSVTSKLIVLICSEYLGVSSESGRADLNRRPLQPHCSALPDCATPRRLCDYTSGNRGSKVMLEIAT
jgi:hypothetical protein